MNKNSGAAFYWLSFLPALAYWWLDENYPLHIALAGGLLLAVLEVTLEKVLTGKVHTLSKMNFGLILVLGVISLVAHEGVWFKLQPTFTGVILSSWLGYRLYNGKSLMEDTMKDMNRTLPMPREILLLLERDLCLFLFCYGSFMAYWAFRGTTSQWAFWKTAGQYLCFAVFLVLEFLLIRVRAKKGNP